MSDKWTPSTKLSSWSRSILCFTAHMPLFVACLHTARFTVCRATSNFLWLNAPRYTCLGNMQDHITRAKGRVSLISLSNSISRWRSAPAGIVPKSLAPTCITMTEGCCWHRTNWWKAPWILATVAPGMPRQSSRKGQRILLLTTHCPRCLIREEPTSQTTCPATRLPSSSNCSWHRKSKYM